MEKMKMESVDMTAQNIEKIGEMFPNCITETYVRGGYRKAVNFELLKQMLSDDVIEGDEAYEFTWVGKKASIVEANKPIRKTLRPCKEESVNWDTTENLYIEGDNLEVLKLLQESYLGKVKMIYIDPPYNTGNDFIYNDDFKMSKEEYAEEQGEYDDEGNRMFKNTETNGRFHSDWCSMIYPRLMLARNLLSDDGVIFISIDDNEQENLKKICDEIFGESNFICLLSVKMSHLSGMKMSHKEKKIPKIKEFVFLYAKSNTNIILNTVYIPGEWEKVMERYSGYIENYDNDIGEWKRIPLSKVCKTLSDKEALAFKLSHADRIFRTAVNDTLSKLPKDNIFKKVISKTGLEKYVYNGEEVLFARSKLRCFDGHLLPADTIGDIWTDIGINNLHNEGGVPFPNGKKPIKLLKRLIEIVGNQDALILDFFSGSATTAHAVMQLNAEDGGNRRFIMVQLPESTAESSEAHKAGYRNICEIGKERIRRAGAKIAAEAGEKAAGLDRGFRCLRLDTSNMTDVYYAPDAVTQDGLFAQVDNVKADRTPEDLLFQTMLDLGILLSEPIAVEEIAGKRVFNVADGFLLACFDRAVTDEAVTAIAKRKPYYAVFRDASMADDSALTNFDQLFAAYSPATVRRVL